MTIAPRRVIAMMGMEAWHWIEAGFALAVLGARPTGGLDRFKGNNLGRAGLPQDHRHRRIPGDM